MTGKAGTGAEEENIVIKLAEADTRTVPVRYGARTSLDLTAAVGLVGALRGAATPVALPGASSQVSMMLTNFVQGNFLLNTLAQRLPPNPGLHLGAAQVGGAGVQPLWSIRFRFKEEGFDRSPHFVSRGTFRLEAFPADAQKGAEGAKGSGEPRAAEESKGTRQKYYIKITWFCRADAADLDLQSRPVVEGPWGLGVGVVPSVSPALYTAGLSYKLITPIELYVGAGIQKSKSTSVVYGVTLDIDDLLDMVFGKQEATKADTGAKTTGSTATDSGSAPSGKPAGTAPPKK
jgi:hypothetical protein